jgi:hypothetical protein
MVVPTGEQEITPNDCPSLGLEETPQAQVVTLMHQTGQDTTPTNNPQPKDTSQLQKNTSISVF